MTRPGAQLNSRHFDTFRETVQSGKKMWLCGCTAQNSERFRVFFYFAFFFVTLGFVDTNMTSCLDKKNMCFVLSRWGVYTGGRADELIWKMVVGAKKDSTPPHRVQDSESQTIVSFLAAGSLNPIVHPLTFKPGTPLLDVKHKLRAHVPRLKNCYLAFFNPDDTQFAHEFLDDHLLEQNENAHETSRAAATATFVVVVSKFKFDKKKFTLPVPPFSSFVWHPTRHHVAVTCKQESPGSTIALWDVDTKELVHRTTLPHNFIRMAKNWDPTGRYICFTENVNLSDFFVLDTQKHDFQHVHNATLLGIGALWDFTGRYLIIHNGSNTGTGIAILDIETHRRIDVNCHNSEEHVMWDPHDHRLIARQIRAYNDAREDGMLPDLTVYKFDPDTFRLSKLHRVIIGCIPYAMSWSPCGKYIAMCHNDKIMLWMPDTEKVACSLDMSIDAYPPLQFVNMQWTSCSQCIILIRRTKPGQQIMETIKLSNSTIVASQSVGKAYRVNIHNDGQIIMCTSKRKALFYST